MNEGNEPNDRAVVELLPAAGWTWRCPLCGTVHTNVRARPARPPETLQAREPWLQGNLGGDLRLPCEVECHACTAQFRAHAGAP